MIQITRPEASVEIEAMTLYNSKNALNKYRKLDMQGEALNALSLKLSGIDLGENKHLESIIVQLEITAPLYFWKQFATYRIGMTSISESTMHTLLKHPITQDNFSLSIPDDTLRRLNFLRESRLFSNLINELPDGYLQARFISTNYKALRNICKQRRNHKLEEWRFFCAWLQYNLIHPEYLTSGVRDI